MAGKLSLRILGEYLKSGEQGLADFELEPLIPEYIPATIRGARVKLYREGWCRKIAEIPNERGRAAFVYALTEKARINLPTLQ